MRRGLFQTALIATLAISSAEAEPLKRVTKIDVDGKTYKVRVVGVTAKASGAAIWTNPEDPTYFPRAKRAIELATGCGVVDSFTTGNKLIATLDCSPQNKR